MSQTNRPQVSVDFQMDSQVDFSNLEDIFQITYSFDKLRLILQMLIAQQKSNSSNISNLVGRMDQMDRISTDHKTLKERFNNLDARQISQEDSLHQMQGSIQGIQTNLNDANITLNSSYRNHDANLQRVDQLQSDLVELKNESNGRLNQINRQVNLVKDSYLPRSLFIEYSQQTKDDLTSGLKEFGAQFQENDSRVAGLESHIKSLNTLVQGHQQQLREGDQQVHSLKFQASKSEQSADEQLQMIKNLQKQLQEKVARQDFNEQTDYLRSQLTQLKNQQQEDEQRFNEREAMEKTYIQVGQRDHNSLKEMAQKFPLIEEKIDAVTNAILKIPKIEDGLTTIKGFVKDMQSLDIDKRLVDLEKHKGDKTEQMLLHDRADQLQSLIEEINKKLMFSSGSGPVRGPYSLQQMQEELQKKVEDLEALLVEQSKRGAGSKSTVQISDTASQNELSQLLANQRKEFEQLKQGLARSVKDIEKQVKFKADISSLSDLEKMVMEVINSNLGSKSSQNEEIKKIKEQLKWLENVMKKLFDQVMDQQEALNNPSQSPNRGTEEDAMFTKRPLGWSCASCDKDIVNLQGRKAEFQKWNRLPQRDPIERMARVGQGFSKMLATIKPEQYDHLQQRNSYNVQPLNEPSDEEGLESTPEGQTTPNRKTHSTQGRRKLIAKPKLNQTQTVIFSRQVNQEGSMTERVSTKFKVASSSLTKSRNNDNNTYSTPQLNCFTPRQPERNSEECTEETRYGTSLLASKDAQSRLNRIPISQGSIRKKLPGIRASTPIKK